MRDGITSPTHTVLGFAKAAAKGNDSTLVIGVLNLSVCTDGVEVGRTIVWVDARGVWVSTSTELVIEGEEVGDLGTAGITATVGVGLVQADKIKTSPNKIKKECWKITLVASIYLNVVCTLP